MRSDLNMLHEILLMFSYFYFGFSQILMLSRHLVDLIRLTIFVSLMFQAAPRNSIVQTNSKLTSSHTAASNPSSVPSAIKHSPAGRTWSNTKEATMPTSASGVRSVVKDFSDRSSFKNTSVRTASKYFDLETGESWGGHGSG